MKKLAIFDQDVSAGGGEQFLFGVVKGLLSAANINDWQIDIYWRNRNSSGVAKDWPEDLKAQNIRVRDLREDKVLDAFDRFFSTGRICNIPGTSRIKQALLKALQGSGIKGLQELGFGFDLTVERICAENNYDVVFFPWPYMMRCPDIKAKVVAIPHDFHYKELSSLTEEHRERINREMPEWLGRCDTIVVSSQFIRSELERFYPEYGNKVVHVRNGIGIETTDLNNHEIEDFKQMYALPDKFMTTVGWLLPHKDKKVVFEALAMQKQKGKFMPLVCVGPNSAQLLPDFDGWISPYAQEIRQVIANSKLEFNKDYFVLGYLSDRQMSALHKLASICVIPSLYEAGSFPMCEAMLAGCPVVVSGIAPLKETFDLVEGQAWIYKPGDADELASCIAEIIDHPDIARQKADAGQKLIGRSYDWLKTGRGYLNVFDALTKSMAKT